MKMNELSAAVRARDVRCKWPGCPFPYGGTNPLECAHLTARGMGGSKTANEVDNAVLLCKQHHDILDGRTVAGRAFEVTELLREYLIVTRTIERKP